MENDNMKSLREKVEQYASSLGTSIKELFGVGAEKNEGKSTGSLSDKLGNILGTKPMGESSSSAEQKEETSDGSPSDAVNEASRTKPPEKSKPKPVSKKNPKYKDDDGKLWIRASPKWTKEQKEKYRLKK